MRLLNFFLLFAVLLCLMEACPVEAQDPSLPSFSGEEIRRGVAFDAAPPLS